MEHRRDAKADEVVESQRNADLTQRAKDIEGEITRLKKQRADEGAAPETTGAEMEPIPALLARVHLISDDTGKR